MSAGMTKVSSGRQRPDWIGENRHKREIHQRAKEVSPPPRDPPAAPVETRQHQFRETPAPRPLGCVVASARAVPGIPSRPVVRRLWRSPGSSVDAVMTFATILSDISTNPE